MKQENRNLTIDVAKGIGIICVILGHLVQYGGNISKIIFTFHMPLFFFLSGYFFSEKVNIQIWKNKIISLMLPFVEFSFLGLILSLVITSWRNDLSFLVLAHHLVWSLQPECLHVGQIWYLAVLAISVTFFMLIKKVTKGKTASLLSLAIISYAVGVLIGSCVRIDLLGHSLRVPFKIDTSLSAVLFCVIGFLTRKHDILNIVDKFTALLKTLVLTVCVILNVFIAYYNKTVNICDATFNNPFLYLFGALSGIIIVMLFAIYIAKKCTGLAKIFGFYGRNSLSIFASHSFFLYLYAYVLSVITGENIMIMHNISIPLAMLGTLLILLCLIPIPCFYSITYGKINRWLISKLHF